MLLITCVYSPQRNLELRFRSLRNSSLRTYSISNETVHDILFAPTNIQVSRKLARMFFFYWYETFIVWLTYIGIQSEPFYCIMSFTHRYVHSLIRSIRASSCELTYNNNNFYLIYTSYRTVTLYSVAHISNIYLKWINTYSFQFYVIIRRDTHGRK